MPLARFFVLIFSIIRLHTTCDLNGSGRLLDFPKRLHYRKMFPKFRSYICPNYLAVVSEYMTDRSSIQGE